VVPVQPASKQAGKLKTLFDKFDEIFLLKNWDGGGGRERIKINHRYTKDIHNNNNAI